MAESNRYQAIVNKIKQEGRKVTEESLIKDKDWIESSKKVYRMDYGKDFQGTDQEAVEFGLERMGKFNYNISGTHIPLKHSKGGTIPDIANLQSQDIETKIAFAYLMDTYDDKDPTMAGFGRFIKEFPQDITTYAGFGAGKAIGTAGVQATKQALKRTLLGEIKQFVSKPAVQTTASASAGGAVYGGGFNLAQQDVKVGAGVQPKINKQEALTVTGAGALAGGVLTPVAPVAIKGAVKGAKRGLEIGLDKFERSPLNASAHIVPVEQARELPYPSAIKEYELLDEIATNTDGASLSSEGLRINLQRFQKPEQEGERSVRTGVFYLPYGDANKKHYKKKDTWYGGTQEISGETLLKRPFVAKGATGGKAPEFAYDAIKGKGSAYNLGNNIRNHVISLPKNDSVREEAVYTILEANGGDSSLAYEIVQNSKQGNQLTYAIQENIIANTLREAGYDSIVGYSKTKAGNKISEVFDLRESNYPYKTMGDVEVHPKFEYAGQWNKSKETK